MNYMLIFKLVGNILKLEAVLMVFPLIISFLYGQGDSVAFLISIVIVSFVGYVFSLLAPKNKKFRARDAFAATSLIWLFFSLCGALPYYFSGYFNSFIDCMFESVSGFTTTGATILTDVEALPKGIAFWRCFSHWIGGMGVLVFILAVMPSMNASSANLMKAETTGPTVSRIVPKIRETARVMYIIYFVMTAVLFLLLMLAGLPAFDAITHAFSTSGTGGFSILNASVGEYHSLAVEIILSISMFLFGISFSLYFFLFTGNLREALKDEELRFYLLITALSIAIITIDITKVYGSFPKALREASFQVTTIISTTGFSSTDYNTWPTLSRFILIMIMMTGCCAGSTGGGIKLIRILILFKAVRVEVSKIIHPRSVKIITINGKKRDNDTVTRVALFFFTYFLIFVSAVIITAAYGYDMITCITAVISTLSNVGPGFGLVGPIDNYSFFNPMSKILLSFCMLAGRLEFFPVLVLFAPAVWKERDTL